MSSKCQAHIKRKSSKRQSHIKLLSYTKSCEIHQYWFPCAFNSDSSPQDPPSTIQKLVKITQDPPVSTHKHQTGPSAGLDVEKGCVTSQVIHENTLPQKVTLVEPATQSCGCGCVCDAQKKDK
ncbi:hypothetical protein O181_037175 [Austropuccinia psidii MF-1]|uniref:Uncharacterized protein n=1 Tax=Austropuccinia psidii MF-1 TaxID=1389203 RepID=A0A9Q3D7R9_9BASI|nr:hypothetical protein [Austropuccinia psidii MF-1]